MKIIVHTMKDCHLCNRLKKMFKEFNVEYDIVLDEPPRDEPYPFIFINDIKYQYEEICLKLFNGEIGE